MFTLRNLVLGLAVVGVGLVSVRSALAGGYGSYGSYAPAYRSYSYAPAVPHCHSPYQVQAYRVPVYQVPVYQAPVYRAPSYGGHCR